MMVYMADVRSVRLKLATRAPATVSLVRMERAILARSLEWGMTRDDSDALSDRSAGWTD
jgi:hypothetical protein